MGEHGMTKNIAILGSGANGSCIAADLVEAGIDVALIDYWPAHVEAMREDGPRIAGDAGDQAELRRRHEAPEPAHRVVALLDRGRAGGSWCIDSLLMRWVKFSPLRTTTTKDPARAARVRR
jgi:hypothetical protein